MRVRHAAAAAVLAAAAVIAAPAVALAQEGEQFADEEAEECHELLEEGKEVDDCQEAPSPILPETNELIWGAISFTALVFLLWKFAWPGISKGLEDRSQRIRSSLEEAEHAKGEAERILDEYRRQLADAKSEAGRIIEESRQTADALRRELQTRAEADIAAMRQRAAADVEGAKTQAIAELRDEVARLAVGAAEIVIQRNLDQDTQMQLIENYINQVSSARGR